MAELILHSDRALWHAKLTTWCAQLAWPPRTDFMHAEGVILVDVRLKRLEVGLQPLGTCGVAGSTPTMTHWNIYKNVWATHSPKNAFRTRKTGDGKAHRTLHDDPSQSMQRETAYLVGSSTVLNPPLLPTYPTAHATHHTGGMWLAARPKGPLHRCCLAVHCWRTEASLQA